MKKRGLCIPLILGLLLCGCSSEESKKTTETLLEVSTEMEVVSTIETDYEVIKNFYESFYNLNKTIDSGNYTSLTAELTKIYPVIDKFEEQALLSDSEYKIYFDEICANNMYIGFKEQYYMNVNQYDLDYPLTQYGYALSIKTYTEGILGVKLPFDYEFASDSDSSETTLYTNAEIRENVEKIMDNAIDNGIDAYRDRVYDSFSYTDGREYSDANIAYKPIIIGEELPEMSMVVQFMSTDLLYPNFDVIYNFVITNGERQIELNSTYELNLMEGMSWIYLYDSSYPDNKKEIYYDIEELVMNNDEITFIINDSISITLTEADLQSLRDYFVVFDSINIYIESVQ